MTDAEKREKVVEGLKELQSHYRAMAGISSSKQGRASHIESARTIGEAIALLKAQEPIKPQVRFNPAGQPMWCCGNCGTTLFFKFHRQTDDEDQRSEHRFCHYCGRKVKWDV